MQNALIAGGSGFIGSQLSARLLLDGISVYCVDNLITGAKNNIISLLDNPNFNFYQEDITKPLDKITDRLPTLNYIFHLASPASPNANSIKSYINLPTETMLAGSLGTYNLLNLAKERKSKFLFASTSEIYGNPSITPQPESYFGNVNPNGPRAVYDEAKRFGEALTFSYLRQYKLDITVIRIFNTYGPNMQKDDGRVVSNFINQAINNFPITIYGDGNQTRSFCYVDDMVEVIYSAAKTQTTSGEVINVGNPDERKISEIASIIKKLTQSNSKIIYESRPIDDPDQRKPDISKAKRLLGWSPKIRLEDGLIKTIDYFRNL